MTDTYMPVAPSNGMGADFMWIILVILLLGGGMGGFGGNGVNPWVMNGQNGINANTNEAFRDAGINAGLDGITAQLGNNTITSMQNTFNAQTAVTQGLTDIRSQLAQCCCDNRLATVQTQNIVQAEAAATRIAIEQQTQAILDKLCQQEIDNLKAANVALQNQLNMANLSASQVAQTSQLEAFILANKTA
jgi:hypothetical protein